MQTDAMFLDEKIWCFRHIRYLPKLKFNTVPVKIVKGFVTKMHKLTLKFYTTNNYQDENQDKFSKLAGLKWDWMTWALCMKKRNLVSYPTPYNKSVQVSYRSKGKVKQ